MKPTFLLILMFLNLTNFSCHNKTDLSDIKGTEIYLLKTEYKDQNSYYIQKTESEQKTLLDKYKVAKDISSENCAYYIDLKNCVSETKPFLNKSDIEKFDWELRKIYLTESGIEKFKKLEIPLRGLAFVIKLNGENVYGGWFWNVFSSFGCDRIYTYPSENVKENELDLKFGLGGFECGTDIRKDKSLIKKVIE